MAARDDDDCRLIVLRRRFGAGGPNVDLTRLMDPATGERQYDRKRRHPEYAACSVHAILLRVDNSSVSGCCLPGFNAQPGFGNRVL